MGGSGGHVLAALQNSQRASCTGKGSGIKATEIKYGTSALANRRFETQGREAAAAFGTGLLGRRRRQRRGVLEGLIVCSSACFRAHPDCTGHRMGRSARQFSWATK